METAINSSPDKAKVFYKSIDIDEWNYLGETPLKTRFPRGYINLKISKNGYVDYVSLTHVGFINRLSKAEKLNYYELTSLSYSKTNMVYTLFCAESEMDDDLIISYSDIIYNKEVLKQLIRNKHDIVVTVDKDWFELWKIRMDDPLIDAETMKLDSDKNIIELGKRANNYNEINGQYIGLIKLSNSLKLKNL